MLSVKVIRIFLYTYLSPEKMANIICRNFVKSKNMIQTLEKASQNI